MKTYTFQYPFQGNRKGDTVTEDKYGQVLVKANEHNVRWTPKEIFRMVNMGMLELTDCDHKSPRREGDELFCEVCKKRWEANDISEE